MKTTAKEKMFLRDSIKAVVSDTDKEKKGSIYTRIGTETNLEESAARKKLSRIINKNVDFAKEELDFEKKPTPKEFIERLAEKFLKFR